MPDRPAAGHLGHRTSWIRACALAFLALVLAPVGPLLAAADAAAERAAIEQVVTDAYVDGVHNFRDPAAMRRGFHPDFEMLVLREGQLVKVTLAKWIEGMEARNLKEPPPKLSPGAPRATTAKFAAVEITGTAATCKVEVWRDGKQLFTDYLALYRFADGWKIVSKTFFSHS
ncbi:MAG: nuclear transport factor 2 family protein [Thermoanaerobaculia bacterium]